MNKDKFNRLDVLDQLSYVNKQLSQGNSLRDISKNLNLSKTTIRNRFKKINYEFNKYERQYLKENVEYKNNTNILSTKPVENKQVQPIKYKSNTNILKEKKAHKDNTEKVSEYKYNTNVLQVKKGENILDSNGEYKYITNILNKENAKEKLIDIIEDYDNIKEMLKWFNKEKNIVEPQEININTKKLIGNVKTTTVRLYDTVWSDFRKFMKDYPEYKSMDLVSMALIEYMDKYKK